MATKAAKVKSIYIIGRVVKQKAGHRDSLIDPFVESRLFDSPNTCCLATIRKATHYGDVIMGTIESQITCLTIVYSTVDSDADHRIHQSSAPLAFVWGIHQGLLNSPHTNGQ